MNICRASIAAFGIALATTAFNQEKPSGYTPKSLVDELIATLNTKDEARIRRFIRMRVISNQPLDQRTTRWKDLAAQGAPFKVVRNFSETADQIIDILSDRFDNRIAMTVHFESKPNVLMLGMSLAPGASVEGSSPDLAGWKDLNTLAAEIAGKASSPGMGIAVLHAGQLNAGVFGLRKVQGKDAVQADDVWSIGSIGKPICASVIGRLIEQGKLQWSETLKRALPGTPIDASYSGVTLEEVMHNRGGIPQDLDLQSADVERIAGIETKPAAIRERYVRDILARKAVALPDSVFVYSNAGYALLAHVAERVAGKPYEQLVKELVFKPLKMSRSFTGVDVLPAGRPVGHVQEGDGLTPKNISGPSEAMFAGAGSGMYMSVGDLARFGAAHLAGLHGQDGFLKASTVVRLHKGILERPKGGRLYACGWGIETVPRVLPFHIHNGSNGTMRSELAIFPDANLVVAAVVNRGGEGDPSPGMQAILAVAERYAHR